MAAAEDGDYDQAMELSRRARAVGVDLGMKFWLASGASDRHIEAWFDHREESLRLLQEEFRALQELGERGYLSTVGGELALRLLDDDRVDEAREAARVAEETGAPDDLATQITLRAFQSRVLARDGRVQEAERMARDVIALAEYARVLQPVRHRSRDPGRCPSLGGRGAKGPQHDHRPPRRGARPRWP